MTNRIMKPVLYCIKFCVSISFLEAVREAREGVAEQFSIEKHNLVARNQKLDNEVKNLKLLLSTDGESSSRPRMLSGLSDAVVGAMRRNTATSQTSAHDEETVPTGKASLERSMEKVITVMLEH